MRHSPIHLRQHLAHPALSPPAANVAARPVRSEDAAPPKPPRLVLRFAVYTAVGLAIAAAGILLFVRQHAISEAEEAVTFHTNFVAQSILPDRLLPSDFARPVTDDRRSQLDRVFRSQVLIGGVLRVTLYGTDGRVTYSSDPSLIGRPAVDQREVGKALGGGEAHRVATIDASGRETKVLGVYIPVRIDRRTPDGAFQLDQDYAPIASAARKTFLPIAAVLEILLLGLYGSLFPLLRRVTHRLRNHVAEIEHQALHDSLTGLPNRDLFRNRISESLAEKRAEGDGLIVMIFDLDHFKEINDTLGHQSGDEVLRRLAPTPPHAMRDSDTVARLGGDEFGVLAPGTADSDTALQLAARVQRAMERPFIVGGLTLQIEASIGIAVSPEHGRRRRDADQARGRRDVPERRRRPSPELYDAEHDHYSPTGSRSWASSGGRSTSRSSCVYYQPRIDLSSGLPLERRGARPLEPSRPRPARARRVPPARPAHGHRPADHEVRPRGRAPAMPLVAGSRSRRQAVGVNLFSRDLLDGGLPDEVGRLLAQCGVRAPASRARDHGGHDPHRPGPNVGHSSSSSAPGASRWRSTTSAPATPRSTTSSACPSTC